MAHICPMQKRNNLRTVHDRFVAMMIHLVRHVSYPSNNRPGWYTHTQAPKILLQPRNRLSAERKIHWSCILGRIEREYRLNLAHESSRNSKHRSKLRIPAKFHEFHPMGGRSPRPLSKETTVATCMHQHPHSSTNARVLNTVIAAECSVLEIGSKYVANIVSGPFHQARA